MVPVRERLFPSSFKDHFEHDDACMSTSEETCDSSTDETLAHKAPVTITSQVHLPGCEGGNVFLPLCAKPSTLKAAQNNPTLVETYIRNALDETDADIVVFIADGAVMHTATMAMGDSLSKAKSTATRISTALRTMVDDALVNIGSTRVKGVMHWSDVEASRGFQAVFSALEEIVVGSHSDEEFMKEIQVHVKTLVKNLFTQRVEKCRAQGVPVTNVFSGLGLEILPKKRYIKKYRCLERSCILEISSILAGFELSGQIFTEMRYLTNDPRGMSFIAECVQKIRHTLKSVDAYPALKEAAAKTYGITFARWHATEPALSVISESESEISEQKAPCVVRKATWGI